MLVLNASSLLDDSSHLLSKVISLTTRSSLSINADSILRTRSTSKRSSILELGNQGIDLGLDTLWLNKLALRISGLEEVTVADLNTHQAVWEVGVGKIPLSWSPGLVCENNLNKKHIRQSISNSLVDQVVEREEGIQSVLLCRRLWLLGANGADSLLGEDDGAVAVGLKVDTDVELGSGVVEPLDAGWGANGWETEGLGDVVGGGTVGIGSLDDTDLQVFCELGLACKVTDEGGRKSSDLVAVEETETVLWVLEVVDDSVGVTVEGATAVVWLGLERWWSTLLGLDEVCTAL